MSNPDQLAELRLALGEIATTYTEHPRKLRVLRLVDEELAKLELAATVPATPAAASMAWNALRDLTDPLGEAGATIMGHVRIYAQRQYEAGLQEGRAPVAGQPADEARTLRDLLARIHGDGGHYLDQHGLVKAAEDAEQMVVAWRADQPAEPSPATADFAVIRSIIHECPALRLPQSVVERLGGVAQIVALKGASPYVAQFIADACNAACIATDVAITRAKGGAA